MKDTSGDSIGMEPVILRHSEATVELLDRGRG